MTSVKDAIAQLDNQTLKVINKHLATKVAFVVTKEIVKGVVVVMIWKAVDLLVDAL